ncbi:hypothetical protein CHARACLAT_017274 [Characodon lateralis]|uniref:Immunoglobulin V-set domain-containing protein n=1 Tax=Characodon lateralis TaxID=208331 RepID=A0ABU7E5C1_9TELE|nr:hypothetical protein [Characodon lateralis]
MIICLLCYFLTADLSLGIQVHQSPFALIRKVGEQVQLVCNHGQGDYRVMLWYQQRPGEDALQLIGYGYVEFKNDSVEEPFRKKHFNLAGDLSGNKAKNGSLFIRNLNAEHTATYFCAASKPQYIKYPPAPDKNLLHSILNSV